MTIDKKPTLHDVIHYVAWMGYIDETKNYSSTCMEAANHIEFWYAHSRATYGKAKTTRLHAVCAGTWSSEFMRDSLEWARKTQDHERFGYKTTNGIKLFNVRHKKYEIKWRAERVPKLMALASAWSKINLANVINQSNTRGYTALHGAVYSGNMELVKLLLEAGAYPEGALPLLYQDDPEAPAIRSTLPAHRSSQILEHFLGSKTTLDIAIEQGYSSIAAELLRAGHRIDSTSERDGLKPIERAIRKNNRSLVQVLLHAGASLDDCIQHTFLIEDPTLMIAFLCQQGVDVNATDSNGRSALLHASRRYKNAIKPLVKNGAILDMRDHLGQTALFLAAANNYFEMVEELLENGANTQIVDNEGYLPIEVTEDNDIKILIARADLKRRFQYRSKKIRK
jgi:ankyrin repeat protein